MVKKSLLLIYPSDVSPVVDLEGSPAGSAPPPLGDEPSDRRRDWHMFMNVSVASSMKLSIRLMLVGLPARRKTEIQNLALSDSVFLSFSMQTG